VVTRIPPSATGLPRLVKICTTPFAASEPYSADAAAPFTSSNALHVLPAMSASPNREITPSTMISGSCRPPMLVAPRSRSEGSPPGCASSGRAAPGDLAFDGLQRARARHGLELVRADGGDGHWQLAAVRRFSDARHDHLVQSERIGSELEVLLLLASGECHRAGHRLVADVRAVSTTCWPRAAVAPIVSV